MVLDRTTEIIAHFAGLLHLSVEEGRLKHLYESFRRDRDATAEDERPEPHPVSLRAPHLPQGYEPGLDWRPEAPPTEPRTVPDLRIDAPEYGRDAGLAFPGVPDTLARAHDLDPHVTIVVRPPAPPPVDEGIGPLDPGSILTVTLQHNHLVDDDLWSNGLDASFVAPAMLHAALGGAAATAVSLSLDAPDAAAMTLAEFAAAARAVAPGPTSDVAALSVTEGPTSGPIVDGEAAGALPILADLLPAAHDDDAAAEDAETDDHHDPFSGFAEAIGDASGDDTEGEDAHPGPALLTGANQLTNATQIQAPWVDAQVFVVGGDVTRVDAVSQVNALFGPPQGAPSVTINAAEITSAPGHAPGLVPGAVPAGWTLTHVPGDLTLINTVTQTSHVTDFDRAEVTAASSAAYVQMGGNDVDNVATIAEFSGAYDLAFVDGDFIDVDIVTQTNVLFDGDLLAERLDAGTGDNLLLNTASVASRGEDAVSPIADDLAATLGGLADDIGAKVDALIADARFAGKEAVNVLHVSGDFAKINVVEQLNVLGDVDQVAVNLAGLGAAIASQVQTGANALANLARIETGAVDSEIMAAGEIYDAAFLHQAELIEPEMPDIAGLASEAVAFLADGLVGEDDGDGPAGPAPMHDGGQADGLAAMVA